MSRDICFVTVIAHILLLDTSSAFCFANAYNVYSTNPDNILFDTAYVNVNGPYNATSRTLTSLPFTGVYWFQLGAGATANNKVTATLNGLQYPVVVTTSTTNYPADFLVADTIQFVNSTTQLAVANQNAVYGAPGGYNGTSLAGFRIDSVMSTLIYFCVQLTQSTYSTSQAVILFNRVVINVGEGWSATTYSFTVPYSGAYFFSFATAAAPGAGDLIYLNVNGVKKGCICSCDFGPDTHNSMLIVRGALMLQLSANDVIQYTNRGANTLVTGTTDGLTSAQGFLYRPMSSSAGVAWSVALVDSTVNAVGPLSVVPYNVVLVNIQGAWDAYASKVTIPVSGNYLIDLTTYVCGSASCGNGNPRKYLRTGT